MPKETNNRLLPWEDLRLTRKDKSGKMVPIYKTEAAFWTKLRGDLRRSTWKNNPIKIRKIQLGRFKIPHPLGGKRRDIWAAKCECCKKTFKMADIQVDHMIPAGAFTAPEHIEGFVMRLAMPSLDDLRLVCKPCHKVITHSEKAGLTFNEAIIDLQRIAFHKLKVMQKRERLAGLYPGKDLTGVRGDDLTALFVKILKRR